jgi:hypothetical protein
MKVIFLDIDGVCNYEKWYKNSEVHTLQEPDLDPKCIERINRLCDLTGAKIVVSSDWRFDGFYKTRLENAGLKNIIGHTPIFIWDYVKSQLNTNRGDEINEWLIQNPEVTEYCIIDDSDDFNDEQHSHFVNVNLYYGFTDNDLNKCLKILKDV